MHPLFRTAFFLLPAPEPLLLQHGRFCTGLLRMAHQQGKIVMGEKVVFTLILKNIKLEIPIFKKFSVKCNLACSTNYYKIRRHRTAHVTP